MLFLPNNFLVLFTFFPHYSNPLLLIFPMLTDSLAYAFRPSFDSVVFLHSSKHFLISLQHNVWIFHLQTGIAEIIIFTWDGYKQIRNGVFTDCIHFTSSFSLRLHEGFASNVHWDFSLSVVMWAARFFLCPWICVGVYLCVRVEWMYSV